MVYCSFVVFVKQHATLAHFKKFGPFGSIWPFEVMAFSLLTAKDELNSLWFNLFSLPIMEYMKLS